MRTSPGSASTSRARSCCPRCCSPRARAAGSCVDLFEDEIAAWRTIDPELDLGRGRDGALASPTSTSTTASASPSSSTSAAGKDSDALSRRSGACSSPAGSLHLTTDVARAAAGRVHRGQELRRGERRWSEARAFFFKHDYAPTRSSRSVGSGRGRSRRTSTRAAEPADRALVLRATFRGRTSTGPFLRFVCPSNFETSPSPSSSPAPGAASSICGS